MRHLFLAIVVLCISFLNCGEDKDLDFMEGLPDKESLKIKFPSKGKALLSEDNLILKTNVGDIAEFYIITRRFTEIVNGSVYFFLSIAEDIAKSPGGKRENDTKVWGPYTPGGLDPKTYKFTLKRLDKGKWSYKLEATGKNSQEFKIILSGEHNKGSRYRRGTGLLMVDFTAIKSIDPARVEEGRVEAVYNTENIPYTLNVTFIDFVGQDGKGPVNSVYKYEVDETGNGVFSYNALMDMDNKGKEENLRLLSRWKSDGSGRCDGKATGGDIEANEILVSECWDSEYKRVYFESFVNSSSYEKQGDSSKCVYSDMKLPE